ncbi:MAG: response regulator, partial [Planctomycetes bacterium]|nr:response regulator [Planctomycetota bacterium]
ETVAAEVLRPLTSRIQSKQLEVVLEMAPDLASGHLVDDVRLRQILTNLAGNAVKFTERGFVRVRIGAVGAAVGAAMQQVQITVQDSGVGIPADRVPLLFTPFTQADSSITRRYAGTGLGLSITDRLVRLMGGSIEVDSTVGVGTTFRVTLPLPLVPGPLLPVPPLEPGWRLVLASPTPQIRQAGAALAQRLGVGFVAAEGVHDLAAVGALGPRDAVLVDDRDPDHDAAIDAAVPVGPGGQRRVLLLTGYQDLARAAARCQERRYAGYLIKPVVGREVAQRLVLLQGGAAPGAELAAPAGSCRAARPGEPLRILVAEDNAVNQKLIERVLQRDGHQVTIAANGRACVEAYARGAFDVVLMDMQMPEMSGIDAAVHIRRGEVVHGGRVPIIALTANTSREDREACLHAGMDEVLAKPLSIPALRALLAHHGRGRTDPDETTAAGGEEPSS